MSASGRGASERLKRIWGFGIATVLLLSVALSLVLNLGGPVAPMRVPAGPDAAEGDAAEPRGMGGLSTALAAMALGVLVLCAGLSVHVFAREWGPRFRDDRGSDVRIEFEIDPRTGHPVRTASAPGSRVSCELCESTVESTVGVVLTAADGVAVTPRIEACDVCLERVVKGEHALLFHPKSTGATMSETDIACTRCGAAATRQFGDTGEPACDACMFQPGVCSTCGKNFGSDDVLIPTGEYKNCRDCDARLEAQVDTGFRSSTRFR